MTKREVCFTVVMKTSIELVKPPIRMRGSKVINFLWKSIGYLRSIFMFY